jgi:hypothetical protein
MNNLSIICILIITHVADGAILTSSTSNNYFYLEWQNDGVLQNSTNLNYWSDIMTETNHAQFEISEKLNFFRVRKNGYTLLSNYSNVNDVVLLNNSNNLVNVWTNSYPMGAAAYLQNDGSLIKLGSVNNTNFNRGGSGGNMQKLDWNNNVTWNFDYSSTNFCLHHDIAIMPNGNILAIAWEIIPEKEALDLGRNPANLRSNANNVVWSETILELAFKNNNEIEIIWKWNVKDHLIQDFDPKKLNYGIIANHPEKINFNYPANDDPDWLHFNSIDYNESLDQILVSSRTFNEIWIIDHSTTSNEVATGEGGQSGMGGDILYRFGNPAAYNRGSESDQLFGGQHNPRWIPKGYKGAGNILVFNNGNHRGNSSVDEIIPPLVSNNYYLSSGNAFGPTNLHWTYNGGTSNRFTAGFVSGAQRLINGNTLITVGTQKRIFEINSAFDIVDDYQVPGQGVIFKAERYYLDIPEN